MNMRELKVGDVVNYRFVTREGELCSAIVEILELKLQKHDNRPIANVRFRESLSDHTGNHLFDYLAGKGGTMWASQEYLYPTTEVNDGENKQAT